MLSPEAAGVAFTANPVTATRGESPSATLPFPVRMFERLRRLLRSLVALLRRLILVALVAVTAGLLVLGLPRRPPDVGW